MYLRSLINNIFITSTLVNGKKIFSSPLESSLKLGTVDSEVPESASISFGGVNRDGTFEVWRACWQEENGGTLNVVLQCIPGEIAKTLANGYSNLYVRANYRKSVKEKDSKYKDSFWVGVDNDKVQQMSQVIIKTLKSQQVVINPLTLDAHVMGNCSIGIELPNQPGQIEDLPGLRTSYYLSFPLSDKYVQTDGGKFVRVVADCTNSAGASSSHIGIGITHMINTPSSHVFYTLERGANSAISCPGNCRAMSDQSPPQFYGCDNFTNRPRHTLYSIDRTHFGRSEDACNQDSDADSMSSECYNCCVPCSFTFVARVKTSGSVVKATPDHLSWAQNGPPPVDWSKGISDWPVSEIEWGRGLPSECKGVSISNVCEKKACSSNSLQGEITIGEGAASKVVFKSGLIFNGGIKIEFTDSACKVEENETVSVILRREELRDVNLAWDLTHGKCH